MKITIIGGGVMGQAIAKAVLEKGLIMPQDLTITDVSLEKLNIFEELGVNLLSDNNKAISGADIILLAVKPQVMSEVLLPLQGKINKEAVVISIAAGVTIKSIQENLNHLAVVRVMPNTPLFIGEGMSGWFANQEVTEEQKESVREILVACGQEVEVENEDEIDMITALSGSGPAYVFLFLKALTEGAQKLGLSEEKAKKAALQTLVGGAILAEVSEDDLQFLIDKVTSKGGTTEAALKKFAELGFQDTVSQAMQAAYDRAKELGK